MNVYRLIDGEALRGAMRLVPSPVTVVTARSGEAIRGITIGSFTSVSLEPPLIS
ncbi:MAG: flavin reductase, partial [Bacteroidetes bacterium]